MTSSIPGTGLLGSSEGNVADDGVFNVGNVGLGDRGVLMMGTEGVGVGEDDEVGEVDDDADLSVTDEGGDEASDEVAEGIMYWSTFDTAKAGCHLNESETGGQ